MEISDGVEIVGELPVVYIKQYRALVLADTHIGFEEDMADKGFYIPRFQLRRVLDILEKALNLVEVDRVIIAGDFKHIFDRLGRIERKEIAEVLMFLLPKVNEVIVVRGNHDNYLVLMQRKYNFKLVNELRLGGILIVHGHKELTEDQKKDSSWRTLIIAHEHPSISLRDSIGTVGKFPCFLVGNLVDGRKVITLPAVGIYQTGSKVTLSRDTYLSPILRDEVVIEQLRPIIVDEEVGVFELPPLAELLDFM